MTVAAEIGDEPHFHDLFRQRDANQSRAERQHIRVVMFAAIARGRNIVRHPRADVGYFVRHDATTDSRAINHNSAPRATCADHLCDGVSEVGVVHWLFAICANVHDNEAQRFDFGLEDSFQFESAVVRAEGDDSLSYGRGRRRVGLRRACDIPDHVLHDLSDFVVVHAVDYLRDEGMRQVRESNRLRYNSIKDLP